MVFEKFVVHLLDKYLSNYIENLDYEKLHIDVWNGNVVLEKLFLKPNALADLHLPVIIKIGYLQKLTLQVPWTTLYSQPTKITIDGLYIVFMPKTDFEYDAKQDEDDQHKAKMKEVDRIEKLYKDTEDLKNPTPIADTNDTFSARMKLQILQNLELSIRNIHIVYEDKITKPIHPFTFGITLHSITFQTTNQEWIPTVITQNTPVIYKLGELNALALYWNTNMKSHTNETIENLRSTIAVGDKQTPKDMAYIFRPFNVKAKLMMTLKPRQQNFSKPMLHLTIDLEHITLNINRVQYLDILDLLEYQDYLTTKLKYIKYRPKKFDNPIEKWKFAYNAIVNEQIQVRLKCYQWKNIQNHSQNCKEYCSLYLQELLGKITNTEKQRTEELEKKLDVFNLIYIRRRIRIEVAKKKQQESKTFFKAISNWWNKTSNQTDPDLDLEKVFSYEEKKKFYQTIGYEGEDASTLTYPKEYVDIDLTIRLLMLDLKIWSKMNENDQEFRVITHANLRDAELTFKRRPATSSALFSVSLNSFHVFGTSPDLNPSKETPPILIQPVSLNNRKLLQAEFEINPLDKDSGYRLQMVTQSLEIKYNAPTINKLMECFEKDSRHHLQGVKQVAYTTYTDVQYRSVVLLKQNIEKVKVLDVYIDIQSSYFLLPEKGIYYDGCPVMCMDLGHLVFQQGNIPIDQIMDNYTQFRLELKNFQLLYANKYENWKTAREENNTRLHLIKPITLYTNLSKCIYSDNIHFPLWKISGQIPEVNLRMSDMRLFKMMKHIQSIPFPQSKKTNDEKTDLWMTEQTLEGLIEEEEIEKKSDPLTQIEANFELSKIDLLLLEEKDHQEYPFLRITFVGICAQTLIKTLETGFQVSLDDLIIFHEQFITKDNQHLQFLAAQKEMNTSNPKKLVMIHVLQTSLGEKGVENQIRIHFSRFMMTLQLEALLSIMKFQDNIMEKWPNDSLGEERRLEKISADSQTTLNTEKSIQKSSVSHPTTLKIEADLEEFRIIIATIHSQMFDIHIQGVKADMHHTSNATRITLILTDFCLFDPNTNARYQKIISQQNADNDLLSVTMVLFNYPTNHTKALDDVDCDVKINFAKANIIFLYKHIDQMMGFLDALNISKAALNLLSNQANTVYEQVQKLQIQAFKLRLNVTLNAPNIIVPVNSSSDEALCLDFGKLILQTKFMDNPKTLLVEQQQILIEDVLASRIRADKKNEIILLECAKLKIDINRLLYPEKVKEKSYISIKMHWDLIHFQLAKEDYLCMMRILMENFREQTGRNVIQGEYRYRQEQQKREEEALRNAVIDKQKERQIGEVLERIKIRMEINKIALTLYLDELHSINHHARHNENFRLAYVEIDLLEIILRQFSDSSYKVVTRVKNFRCDDLRETHQADAIIHIIDRHYTVDPNAYMLIASLDFKPKDQIHSVTQRLLNIQLESLYICIKLDYLMMLQDFFMSNLPIDDGNSSEIVISEGDNSIASVPSSSNSDVKTRIDILVKNPEMILLEDQRNSHSNCLVLNFASNLHVVSIGNDMQIFGEMKDLTIYSSNLTELKDLKMKYRILQPAKVDFTILMNSEEEKIDLRISNIIVNITSTAVRILIGVTNSFGKPPPIPQDEKFDIPTMFNHKSFDEANFWFLQKEESDDQSSTKKFLTKNEKKSLETNLSQLFFLTLKTIEIKLDIGFDLITKSVVAMCLSNLTVDLQNWSNQMTVSSSMDIEAALYNEHTLAWEPLIEPTFDKYGRHLLPWNITCSVKPILPKSDHRPSTHKNEQQRRVSGLKARQLISLRTGQLLNITITKTGVELIQHLSTIYNQHIPKSLDHNEAMLSLVNFTGENIFINNLNGLEFTDDIMWTSKVLERNESISLTAVADRLSSAYRLSVIKEQTSQNRQEFSLQINNHMKLISINRTWQRIYNIQSSSPIQILCDTQIHHNHRRVILSSIVKILNHTKLPIVLLDFDSITGQTFHRIKSNETYYVPIDLLYKNSNSSIFLAVDESDQNMPVSDFFVFDWKKTIIEEQDLGLKNGQIVHLVVYKEIKEAYSENTDQLDQVSFCIYIHSPIQLTNLLPINIQCWINNVEEIYLKPSEVRLITSGNKNSVLKFMLPLDDERKWISDPVDLGVLTKKSDSNEQIITFHNAQENLRMVLHMEIFHKSYRLLLYTPFWIVNRTNLKLEFRIGSESMFIKNTGTTALLCPEKYQTNTSEKGRIRLYNVKKDDSTINWSEKFSLDVIKSIGMASCKGSNDKTYMICVDITTSSFGLTKILTLSPAMVIINQTSIPLEIVETIMGKEQNKWIRIEPDDIIPFWPQNAKESLMYVRYAHNRKTSKPFLMNKKHQTLLYMHDKEHLVIYVEVIATDFDGVRMIFSDYKSGDAPVLLVNHTKDQLISFVQKDDRNVQYLVPKHFVYYTWMDPLKPREMSVASNGKPKTIEFSPHRGILDTNENVSYVIFIDGVQTVLLFSDNQQIIDKALNIPSSTKSICRHLQIGISDVGLSIVNDITREELLYISLNKSRVLWIETRKSRIHPISSNIQRRLEDLYQTNLQLTKENLNPKKYQMNEYREIIFAGNTAELINDKGEHRFAKRQSLDGLWIGYTWSMAHGALYVRINHVQIDIQLDCTHFPSMLYPVLPKTTASDSVDKPFIELSIYETKTAQSNIMHFQYCKLLVQEFVLRIDQGLIVAILAFFRKEKNTMTSMINMKTDLEQIHKSLQAIVKAQTDFSKGETQMYFDNIHLSPLKIHITFSMHGSKSNEELFAEYPLVGFLLRTLNIAEVQDVILRLGFYERSFDRYTMMKLQNEVLAHYQNQFLKQIHVLVLGLDVLGNPLGIIRGLAEGVESLFYEPYKGAIEGPVEFAEGVATGVLTFVGSTVGTAAGTISRITGVIGQSLATLTFDKEYKDSRIRHREPTDNAVKDIATGGKNVLMGFVHGVTGVVTKPVSGAMRGGVAGFATGLGQGVLGLAAQPIGSVVDFTSTTLDVVKRTASQEQTVYRVRYPRHVGRDGLVRPYVPHEAMGLYMLNRLDKGKYAKTDTYIAHITCSDDSANCLMATSKRILFITDTCFLGSYSIDWIINYMELQQIPVVIPDKQAIQILMKKRPNTNASEANQSFGKLVKYRTISDAHYLVDKITNAMHSIGL